MVIPLPDEHTLGKEGLLWGHSLRGAFYPGGEASGSCSRIQRSTNTSAQLTFFFLFRAGLLPYSI